MEDKDTYLFWFFIQEGYPFLLWIGSVLVDRVEVINCKGQSLILGHFFDRYVSSGLWLLLCSLNVMVYILSMELIVFLSAAMRENLRFPLAFR